jgi:RNA polymerase sigma-70 factor (ECF subfamily)
MTLIDTRREEISGGLSLRAEKLRDCVAKLPPEQRASLTRYYNDEESVDSIALREGRTPDAVYKMLQRTRRVLLECVERGLRNYHATA